MKKGMFQRLSRDFMLAVPGAEKERNIYVHPNYIARDIFWKRLEQVYSYLLLHTQPKDKVLDFGGGSGAFIPTLSEYYDFITVIDLDVSDANWITNKLGVKNVEILNQNVFEYLPKNKFDVVILTDVLEHFQNLSDPISWLQKNVSEGGRIFVSLPTENWIYELGRKIVRKQKPADHYHASKDVLAKLQDNNFHLVEKCFVPNYLMPIPLFEIAVLQYEISN